MGKERLDYSDTYPLDVPTWAESWADPSARILIRINSTRTTLLKVLKASTGELPALLEELEGDDKAARVLRGLRHVLKDDSSDARISSVLSESSHMSPQLRRDVAVVTSVKSGPELGDWELLIAEVLNHVKDTLASVT